MTSGLHYGICCSVRFTASASSLFNIDVETCRVCGGNAKVIACIEDPAVISKILKHLQEQSSLDSGVQIANPRAPPQALSGEFFMLNEWPVLANGVEKVGRLGRRFHSG